MNEFDQQYMTKVLALHGEMRLDSGDDPQTRLWHLLRSMIEFCDAQRPRIDFDALLEDVRGDFNSDRRTTLDEAAEAFEHTPSHETALQYRATASDYFDDGMITGSEHTAIIQQTEALACQGPK